MKQKVFNWMAVLALAFSLVGLGSAAAQQLEAVDSVPRVVSYQGSVSVDGAPYNGAGYFKFAVVDSQGDTTYWSNDGTSIGGAEPSGGVALTVSGGLFNVLLGNAPMVSLGAGAFEGPDRALRVWFSADGGASYTLLAPDRKIASVPFALQAEEAAHADYADNADTLDGLNSTDLQKDISVQCEPGLAVSIIYPGGAAFCTPTEHRPVFTANAISSLYSMHSQSAITMGVDGAPLLVSGMRVNDDQILFMIRCNDSICSDTAAPGTVLIGAQWLYGVMPTLTIGADGFPVIAFYDFYHNDLVVVHCRDYLCNSPHDKTTVDSIVQGNVGLNPSIAIGVDGLALISYYDETNGNLKVAHCNSIDCTSFSTRTLVDATNIVGEYSSVTILADGLPLISYNDVATDDLWVVHCSDAACSAADAPVHLSPSGGAYSSVTTGADGYGLISYYHSTAGDLGVAHCNNFTCSDYDLNTLDASAADTGGFTSITTGSDSLGLISYYDFTNRNLKVAHCSNVACSAATLSTVDSSGEVGSNTAITIGQDGLGLISYYDADNNRIKVLHLSNLFGLPYVRRR